MHVVHVANAHHPASGGLRTAMHALGAGYRAAGHEVTLVVPGARAGVRATGAGRVVSLAAPRVPGSGGYRLMTDVDRVGVLLDHLAPDRLEVSDRLTLRDLGWWARSAGVPSVFFAHERVDGVLRAFAPGLPARALADLHNAGTASRFDALVCTTAYAAQEFERIGAPGVHRVPLGVDLEAFGPARADRRVRRALAPAGGPLLVLCSRLSREKRPGAALAALRELHRRGVPASLAVAGSGPLERRLRRAVRGLPVTFLGAVDDRASLAAVLASADAVLAPGPVETFGLAALEALACGTPVVAASSSALAELLTPGTGRLAGASASEWADAVQDLLADPPRPGAARARAEQFPWARTVAAMLALHGRLGAPARVPGPRGPVAVSR